MLKCPPVTSGALFFVKPIRSKNYVTLMDPFQQKYGNTVAAVIFIPSLMADILWAACILGILGKIEATHTFFLYQHQIFNVLILDPFWWLDYNCLFVFNHL